MSLFASRPRTDARLAKRREPRYAFLDRVDRPEYQSIRDLLDQWFGRYPGSASADLRGRFAADNDAHNGAFFELFLHELLSRSGFSVSVGGVGQPDFLAVAGDGVPFYLEATTVNPKSSLWASDPLMDDVLDALDEIDSPGFRLNIQVSGKLSQLPRRWEVIRPFQNFVRAHDPDIVEETIRSKGLRAAPALKVTHGTWSLTATLMPKPAHRRGPGFGRPIGVGPTRGGFVDAVNPVRDALLDKAAKYRNLAAPYVIAVNAPDLDDRIDEMQVLFGDEQFVYQFGSDDLEPEFTRKRNGLWYRGGDRPRATHVDAVLFFRGVAPWHLADVHSCLYLNPYIAQRLNVTPLTLPFASAENDDMKWHGGERLGTILGLDARWPLESSGPTFHSSTGAPI